MKPGLLVNETSNVQVLTLNRPEKRNALDTSTTRALLEALRAVEANDEIGCVIMTGASSCFCSGVDISELRDQSVNNSAAAQARRNLIIELFSFMPKMSKPVVAAINGPALGAGAGLAIAADLILMAETAVIGYPEIRRGLVATLMIPNLVRQVGRKAAFELVSLGQPMDAATALQLGVVNKVTPLDRLMDQALAMATAAAALDRLAMARTKTLFHEVADLTLDEAFKHADERAACWDAAG